MVEYMKKILKLVKANLYKDKTHIIIFTLILCVSSMLMHTALTVFKYSSLFDNKCDTQNTADIVCHGIGDRDVLEKKVENFSFVKEYSMQDCIDDFFNITKDGEKSLNDLEGSIELILLEYNEWGIENKPHFIEESDENYENAIYVNLYISMHYDLHVGDKVTFKSEDLGSQTYTVGGVFESLIVGNAYSEEACYLSKSAFSNIKETAKKDVVDGIAAHFQNYCLCHVHEGDDLEANTSTIVREFTKYGGGSWGYSIDEAKVAYTGVSTIMYAIIGVFAVVIAIVTIIMIGFTISNNINRDIRNIGALRAVGFTYKQISLAIMIEFVIIAAIGTGLGIALSYITFPYIEENFFREQVALSWNYKFMPDVAGIVICFIEIVVLLVTFFTTRKIKSLHPAIALRFGLQANSFKRNHFPLADTKGRLNILLAIKSTCQNFSQNVILLFIMTVISFVSMFSAVLFYNSQIDPTAFSRMLIGDVTDAIIYFNTEGTTADDIKDTLGNIDGVKEVYYLEMASCYIDEYTTFAIYSDNCENINCGLYEGVMPVKDNEVVLGSLLAENLDVGVSDEIVIENADIKQKYVITGLQQSVYGMGVRTYMTDGGAKRLKLDVPHTEYRVRVDEQSEESIDKFINEAKEQLGSNFSDSENVYKFQRSSSNTPLLAMKLVVLLLVIVSMVIVILVLNLLLKTVLIKNEKEFGIKKAVGFTSKQIRLQLALSLTPIILLASISGSIIGYFLSNKLIAVMFRSFGIMKSDFIIHAGMIPIVSILMVVFTFVMAYLMSGRIKRISAYKLIQE